MFSLLSGAAVSGWESTRNAGENGGGNGGASSLTESSKVRIDSTDIYKLNYFTYNKPFTGSCGKMRYRIIRVQDEKREEAHFLAAVYPQPFCWEATPEEQKQKKEFPFSEEGRADMIDWLNEKREEFEEDHLKGTEQ